MAKFAKFGLDFVYCSTDTAAAATFTSVEAATGTIDATELLLNC